MLVAGLMERQQASLRQVLDGMLRERTRFDGARNRVERLRAGAARLEILDGAGRLHWKHVPGVYWPLLTDVVVSES